MFTCARVPLLACPAVFVRHRKIAGTVAMNCQHSTAPIMRKRTLLDKPAVALKASTVSSATRRSPRAFVIALLRLSVDLGVCAVDLYLPHYPPERHHDILCPHATKVSLLRSRQGADRFQRRADASPDRRRGGNRRGKSPDGHLRQRSAAPTTSPAGSPTANSTRPFAAKTRNPARFRRASRGRQRHLRVSIRPCCRWWPNCSRPAIRWASSRTPATIHWNCCSRRYRSSTKVFDVHALSFQIGAVKPEAAIFHAAAELAGVTAGRDFLRR